MQSSSGKIALRSSLTFQGWGGGSSSSCGKPLPRSNFYVMLLEWTGTIEPDSPRASSFALDLENFAAEPLKSQSGRDERKYTL